jgi:pyridoxal phosphate enzyme (YggS family)
MSIAKNIDQVKANLPGHVRLVAVSKTKPVELLMEAYQHGQRVFGENKVQEMVAKYEAMPQDIDWHFIGHLQTNKVKYMASFVKLIHGVDTFKLLKSIDTEARKVPRIIPSLLQFHIAEEETKFGLSMDEAIEMLESTEFHSLKNVQIAGVMGMATFTNDENQIRKEFSCLKSFFDQLKSDYFADDPEFKEISMGMSGDYRIAVEQGSTMVRIGSTIFGERTYTQAT